MRRSDLDLVRDALSHLEVMHRHLGRGELDDQVISDAVNLRLAAAIETLSQASEDLRGRVFEGQWHVAWATRNRIAHSYTYIDLATVRVTIAEDIPILEAALRRELEA